MRWLNRLFFRRTIYTDLSEEIRQHLTEKTESLMAQGMSREDAECAAKREFGNVTGIEERSREPWLWPGVESLWGDTKFAFRQLFKNFGFTLSACLTLALGIGATTAIFSMVNSVLLRPLPFPEQERLVWVSQQDHSLPGVASEALSYPDYFDWRDQNRTLSSIASHRSATLTLETEGEARRLDAATVSANFFGVLGVAPQLGRDFQAEDDKPGNRAVMLSHSLWQSAFGSDPAISGKKIKLGDHAFIVAGVMPEDFRFPLDGPAPALWISMADDAEGKDPATGQRGFDCLETIGRMKPGVSLAQVRADLSLIAGNLARQYPDHNKWYTSALVETELRHLTGDARPALGVLFGAVTLVLLIACANVAGLLLARGSRRSAEFALRASLGASRAAIVRQLLVESVLLFLGGGIAGAALAFALLRAMVRFMPLDIPRMGNASIDGTVLIFVLLVSVVSGLLFGAVPAWRMSELNPANTLRGGSRSVTGSRGQHRAYDLLVISQTAIGLVLLVSSGLLMRSFVDILKVDPGFDSKNVMTARIGVSFDMLKHDQHVQFYDQLLERISAFPGVVSVSAGWPLPMSDNNATISFDIDGRPVAKGDQPSEPLGIATPGYFETMRIPLISGRTFRAEDTPASAPVTIVNQAFARKHFPGENPIGRRIQPGLGDGQINHPMREIVGVVGNVKMRGLTTSPSPQFYLPYSQAVVTNPYLLIRTSGDSTAMSAALRATLNGMDRSVPLYEVSTLEKYVSTSTAQPRFQTLIFTWFAGIALLLAAIGLYGLLSYMVVQRTLEIGLRMALGAERTTVLGMIVRRGLKLALIGVAGGLIISAATTRFISGMLFGIRANDPVTFLAMSAVFLIVTVVASSIPAYRAANLDPIKALKES